MNNAEALLGLPGVKQYDKGAIIVQEGDASCKDMFIFLQGSAEVYKNYAKPNEIHLSTYTAPTFLGDAWLFLGKIPPATVVANDQVVVLSINRQNASQVFANQPEIAFMIMEGLSKKLDTLGQSYESLRAKIPGGVADEQGYSKSNPLFPKAHGSYLITLDNENSKYLYEQHITCPLCNHSFTSLTTLASKLTLDRTDDDLRAHYKDIDPLHYDVVSCPNCLYSAFNDQFPRVSKSSANRVDQEIGNFKGSVEIKAGLNRDTFTIFAGYYLALLCAPICFDDYQVILAKLWLRLSRLYKDCSDQTMHLFACEQALKEYTYSYEHFNFSERVIQQICYLVGDLYYKLDDIDNARNYFFMVKTNRAGSKVLTRQAENRLDEIRELKKAAAANS